MANLVGTVANSFRYRGREGQWAWMLHRITGLGVVFFLLLHIFDIFLMAAGREVFEDFLGLVSFQVQSDTFLVSIKKANIGETIFSSPSTITFSPLLLM